MQTRERASERAKLAGDLWTGATSGAKVDSAAEAHKCLWRLLVALPFELSCSATPFRPPLDASFWSLARSLGGRICSTVWLGSGLQMDICAGGVTLDQPENSPAARSESIHLLACAKGEKLASKPSWVRLVPLASS